MCFGFYHAAAVFRREIRELRGCILGCDAYGEKHLVPTRGYVFYHAVAVVWIRQRRKYHHLKSRKKKRREWAYSYNTKKIPLFLFFKI